MANTSYIGVNHDLRSVDGKHIQMPPWFAGEADEGVWGNLKIPDVYTSTVAPSYPRGTIFRDGLRTFIYSRHSSATPSKRAGYLVKTTAAHYDISNGVISGASGASTVNITYSGCTVNKYAGGFLGIKGTVYRSCYIISNTVAATIGSDSNVVIFTVDGSWPTALATTDDVVLTEHPYKEVVTHLTGLDTAMWMGVLMDDQIAASEYGWLQTWGPNNMMHPHNSWEGADGEQLQVYGIHGNTQQLPDTTSAITHGSCVPGTQQVVGLAYAESGGADYSVGTTVWLTIMP